MGKKGQCIAAVAALTIVLCGAEVMKSGIPEETSVTPLAGRVSSSKYAPPDLEYLEYYGLEAFETDLPVILIDTGGRRLSAENKVWASIGVLDKNMDGTPNSILETPDYTSPITIKYRGASSYFGFDKSQYRIKFYREEGKSKSDSYEFLGMGSHSEWVLNGPFLDKTLLRNRLIYGLSREIFEWAPDCRYVEVFVDGKYQGLYLAIEPVGNGESRLRLSEFGLITGECAYIVKRDRIGTEENPLDVYAKWAGKTNNDLYVEYPSSARLTEAQRDWIEKDISNFERVLYSEDFADPVLGYAKYIDVESFVDYFILNETVMNNDAGNLSTYAYKELGGKLQMAVWDFNNAYDNYQWFPQDFTKFFSAEAAWISELLKDRAFVDKVTARYEELRQSVLSTKHIFDTIENCIGEMGEARERNFAIWGYTYYKDYYSGGGKDRNTKNYEEAIEQLKQAVVRRFDFLDENIAKLYEYCIN